jgi:hypothetical protein
MENSEPFYALPGIHVARGKKSASERKRKTPISKDGGRWARNYFAPNVDASTIRGNNQTACWSHWAQRLVVKSRGSG